jgi:hypothetical protein
MERNLTTGSIWKNIFYFSLPYLLSYFLQTLYGMADLFIIGQFEGAASRFHRQSGYAYDYRYHRGTFHGNDCQHRAGRRRKR